MNSISQSNFSTTQPRCPSCGRECEAGRTWRGANYCRGLALLRFIEDEPGLSGWELSQKSGVPYTDATRGLAKLREYRVVHTESVERTKGGIRYHYWPVDDVATRQKFVEAVRRVEGLN